jgi:hypothetical protein
MTKKAPSLAVHFGRLLCVCLGLQLPAPCYSAPFYKYAAVAQVGQPGTEFTSLSPQCAVNDKGEVVFIASTALGQWVYLYESTNASLRALSATTDTGPNRSFGSVWINNFGYVATTFLVSGNPKRDEVRLYSCAYPPVPFVRLAFGGGARDQYGNPQYPFDNIYPSLCLNDSSAVAFSGQIPFTTSTGLTNTTGVGKIGFSGFVDLRPAMTSDGRVAMRSGGQATSSLHLWAPGFQSNQVVATVSDGFTKMGKSPGVSDNGSIVVFAGDRGRGPGIFASCTNPTNASGPRLIVHLLGENASAQGPGFELGTNSIGQNFYFTDFQFRRQSATKDI